MIHGHGDDIYSYSVAIKHNFSSNVYEGSDNNWLRQFLQERWSVLHSYPEPNASSFVAQVAAKYNIATNTICATHGATDAIYLIAQAFRGSQTAIFVPTFAEYEDACTVNQHQLSFISDLGEITEEYDLIWLCNPNNPTGKTHHFEQLLQLIDAYPQTTFVIDQTYRYFTKEKTLSYAAAVQRENLILVDSFTKRFALPDLRLGYFVACPSLIEHIQYYKQPWAVSQLAIEVGKYVMEAAPYPLNLDRLLQETKRLQGALSEIAQIEVLATDTHFFLCKMKYGKASELKAYLVQKHGILIRDAANFRSLNDAFFRIATQQKEENNSLIVAIQSYFEEIER